MMVYRVRVLLQFAVVIKVPALRHAHEYGVSKFSLGNSHGESTCLDLRFNIVAKSKTKCIVDHIHIIIISLGYNIKLGLKLSLIL
jgi:hypothetical protein